MENQEVLEDDRSMLTVKIKRLRSDLPLLPLPKTMTEGASGYDLMADIEAPITLLPKERILVPTGILLEIPRGYEAQIRPRSGLAIKQGVTALNSPGTIDSDYRGEIKIILINLGNENVAIKRGDRIAQLVFQKVIEVQWQEVDELKESIRGEGGFGHTAV